MALNIQSRCTLKSDKADSYTIVCEGKVSTPENAPAIETNGVQISMEMGGQTNSEIKIDKKTGWLIAGTAILKMAGKSRILPNDKMPDGMDIPMVIKTTTNYTGEK